MAFEKGHKKIGGRKKGSTNRLTKDLRKDLKEIVISGHLKPIDFQLFRIQFSVVHFDRFLQLDSIIIANGKTYSINFFNFIA